MLRGHPLPDRTPTRRPAGRGGGLAQGDVLVLCGVPSRLAPVVLGQVSGLGGEVTTAGGVEGEAIEVRILCG